LPRLVVDTSILIEYIVKSAPHRGRVVGLFEKASSGEFELYVSPITLSEALYIASRIYGMAGARDPNGDALDYILWVKGRTRVAKVDEDLAIRAGELRKLLGISLPDCYVIATAEAVEAIPLFKGVEREMEPILTGLKGLNVEFLEGFEGI